MMVHSCVKFQNIWNGFQLTERTSEMAIFNIYYVQRATTKKKKKKKIK